MNVDPVTRVNMAIDTFPNRLLRGVITGAFMEFVCVVSRIQLGFRLNRDQDSNKNLRRLTGREVNIELKNSSVLTLLGRHSS